MLNTRDDALVKRLDKHDNRLSDLEDEVSRIPTRVEIDTAREVSRQEIIRVHSRLDDIHKDNKQTQLLLGELLGYYKGMTNGKS